MSVILLGRAGRRRTLAVRLEVLMGTGQPIAYAKVGI